MLEPRTLYQHLLFVYFALDPPLRFGGYWLYQKVRGKKASPRRPLDKARYYRQETTIQWLLTLYVMVAMGGLAPLFYAPAKLRLAWNEVETWVLVVLVSGVFAWLLLEIVPSPWRAQRRATVLKDLERIAHIVPETRHERRWWLWVCVTAGVCEELVYRGFLIRYLHEHIYGSTAVPSVFLSSLFFGAKHISQGKASVVFSGIGGLMLGALFLLSGNLLLPIMVHALVDARILWVRSKGSRRNNFTFCCRPPGPRRR